MFCRLLLGDLFIHGIGGAKYDEVGDAIARRFFGFEPPDFLTLSMTLWLGYPEQPADQGQLVSMNHQLRDLYFNPERHGSEPIPEEMRILIQAKHQAIAGLVTTRQQRRARFREIRRCNEALQPLVQTQREALRALRTRVLQELEWNRVVRNREYAFVLHSVQRLQGALVGLVSEVKHGKGVRAQNV
jgi:hypothetical protein